jgi:hypothetical protein
MSKRWRAAALIAIALVLCSSPVARTAAQDKPAANGAGQDAPAQDRPAQSGPAHNGPAQTAPLPEPRDSSSPSSDPDMSATTGRAPRQTREARSGGISAGSLVQNPAGETIGRVKDIVPDSNTGEPDYIIIATRSGNTAVPYTVVAPMYQNGHVVLDKSRLESAPHLRDSQLQDKSTDATWRKDSERYWESQNPARLR